MKPSRPELALRVGITGTRNLTGDEGIWLTRKLDEVFSAVRAHMEAAAASDRCGSVYAHSVPGAQLARHAPVPTLRFLSPLARGADRLAARAALANGFTLHVPMPFPQITYEQDFETAADLEEFRALLKQAGDSRLELDGDRTTGRDGAYEAVGRYVVRNCDLLIAIWDGETDGTGRGGTAEIVRYGIATGVPVWWLHARQDAPPAWLADIQELRDPRPDAPPENKLAAHIHALVTPPTPCPRRHRGMLERFAHAGHEHDVTPLAEYLGGALTPASQAVWRSYDRFMRIMAGGWAGGAEDTMTVSSAGSRDARNAAAPGDQVAAFWFARFRSADSLAILYADRYRSGYIWTFLFATLSVLFGACSLLPHRGTWIAACNAGELVMLVLILLLVGRGIRQDWHEHSIEFRLLAELCRKQQALGPLGWTLPILELRCLTDEEDEMPERGAWVAWLFAAEERSAPFPIGILAEAAAGPLRRAVLDELIGEQLAYHEHRARSDGRAAVRLALTSEGLFLGILAAIGLKFGLSFAGIEGQRAWPLGLLVTVLPALSAAFMGIRAYSEVPLLAVQSRHMAAALKAAHRRVERLQGPRPLLSQDLGAEAASVATLMLQDLDGWARLFRVKSLEAGG